MNIIAIHGRLVRKPEIKTYNRDVKEGSVSTFTVAVDKDFGDGADFFECVIFGKRAEVIEKFFDKGSEIALTGAMHCEPYEAKDGTKRYPWRLTVSSFDFCGSKKNGDSNTPSPADGFTDSLDDIPF